MTKAKPSPDVFHQLGWTLYDASDFHGMYYRWQGDTRHELHLCYDRAGRLEAWTHWANRRITPPDQEPGRRKRLLAYAARWDRTPIIADMTGALDDDRDRFADAVRAAARLRNQHP